MTKHIMIIIPDLSGGGTERLHVHLANDWIKKGFSVEFVVMRERNELNFLLDAEIKVTNLEVLRIRDVIFPLAVVLRKSSAQVVIAAMWPLTSAVVMSCLLSRRLDKLYLSDHENLSLSYIEQRRNSSFFLRSLVRFTYPLAKGIIAVSHGVKEDLCFLGHLSADKIRVIYNPAATGVSTQVESSEVKDSLWGAGYDKHILTAGRLSFQKDHATLLKAFAMLQNYTNSKLVILGEGPLRTQLSSLIIELGLEDRVSMPGFVCDPYPWFLSADLFVLSSRWEGFGNVIVEALECGVPIVSTNCPSGPDEILKHGQYGKLVPVQDHMALAFAMKESLHQTHDRDALKARSQDFSVLKISDEYLSYIFPEGS
jgi:glycosyltransferase involved in cell wall biosynthesis